MSALWGIDETVYNWPKTRTELGNETDYLDGEETPDYEAILECFSTIEDES